MNAHKKILG